MTLRKAAALGPRAGHHRPAVEEIRLFFKRRVEGVLVRGVAVTWADRRQEVAADLQARGYKVLARHGE